MNQNKKKKRKLWCIVLSALFIFSASMMVTFATNDDETSNATLESSLKTYDAKMVKKARSERKAYEDVHGAASSATDNTDTPTTDNPDVGKDNAGTGNYTDTSQDDTGANEKQESKILSSIYLQLSSPDSGKNTDIKTREQGNAILDEACKKNNVDSVAIKSLFAAAAQNYGVIADDSALPDEDDLDESLLNTATKTLHVLWWDGDSSGSNQSSMQIMINKLLLPGSAPYTVMSLCTALGAALCLVFGLMDILEKATERSVSTEALWRAFLKLCLGIWIIYNCLYIASAIIYIGGNLILKTVMLDSAGNSTDTEAFKLRMALWQAVIAAEQQGGIAKLNGTIAAGGYGVTKTLLQTAGSFVAGAASTAYAAISSIGPLKTIVDLFNGSKIIQFFSSLTIYAIAIEMGIRFVFTPIAVADMFSEKFRSTGIRWLKNLAACALQGTIVYVTIIVGTNLRETLEAGAAIPGFSPVTSTLVNFTMIGFFAKSRGFAQEIFGVH